MARKKNDKERAQKVARDGLPDDHDHRLPYVDAFDHHVARARGLDPACIVDRDVPAKSPDKPTPPYSR
jgi:hypothetical protein